MIDVYYPPETSSIRFTCLHLRRFCWSGVETKMLLENKMIFFNTFQRWRYLIIWVWDILVQSRRKAIRCKILVGWYSWLRAYKYNSWSILDHWSRYPRRLIRDKWGNRLNPIFCRKFGLTIVCFLSIKTNVYTIHLWVLEQTGKFQGLIQGHPRSLSLSYVVCDLCVLCWHAKSWEGSCSIQADITIVNAFHFVEDRKCITFQIPCSKSNI